MDNNDEPPPNADCVLPDRLDRMVPCACKDVVCRPSIQTFRAGTPAYILGNRVGFAGLSTIYPAR